MNLLEVKQLHVQFNTQDGVIHAVNGLDFKLKRGQTLGIVGESGSGKSQTVLAMMGLLAHNAATEGEVLFEGKNLLTLPVNELNTIRGNRMAMIFQDPMTSLNPYLTIERQMTEVLELHKGLSRAQAVQRAIEVLDAVKIPEAAKRINMYPHEFSGGMRQRVMIAMALLCEPEILIADEPTTALDVTVQAQILTLMRDLQKVSQTAIILITHDLGVVAGLCDNVMVMYAGHVVEHGNVHHIFNTPTHPYTLGLQKAIPKLDQNTPRLLAIEGAPPNITHLPPGCAFEPRCQYAFSKCKQSRPLLQSEISPLTSHQPNTSQYHHAPIWRACHKPSVELLN